MNLSLPGIEQEVGSMEFPKQLLHRGHPDRGFMYERTKYVDPYRKICKNREKVFADAWEKENKKRPGLNQGFGILQDLLFKNHWEPVYWVSAVERWVVATVIQWLGTNCGFSWLCEVLSQCGYTVMSKESIHRIIDRDREVRDAELVRIRAQAMEEIERRQKLKESANQWNKRRLAL